MKDIFSTSLLLTIPILYDEHGISRRRSIARPVRLIPEFLYATDHLEPVDRKPNRARGGAYPRSYR